MLNGQVSLKNKDGRRSRLEVPASPLSHFRALIYSNFGLIVFHSNRSCSYYSKVLPAMICPLQYYSGIYCKFEAVRVSANYQWLALANAVNAEFSLGAQR